MNGAIRILYCIKPVHMKIQIVYGIPTECLFWKFLQYAFHSGEVTSANVDDYYVSYFESVIVGVAGYSVWREEKLAVYRFYIYRLREA